MSAYQEWVDTIAEIDEAGELSGLDAYIVSDKSEVEVGAFPDERRAWSDTGFKLAHECSQSEVWLRPSCTYYECRCGAVVGHGLRLTIQLKPEQETAMREVLHVRA